MKNSFSSDDDSSGFFSPVAIAAFQPKRISAITPERLPTVHDTSWIGARLSPIRSFDYDPVSPSDDDGGNTEKMAMNTGKADATESAATIRRNADSAFRLQQRQPQLFTVSSHERSKLLLRPGHGFHPRYSPSSWPPPNHYANRKAFRIGLPNTAGLVVCGISLFHLVIITVDAWMRNSARCWEEALEVADATPTNLLHRLGVYLRAAPWRADRTTLLRWGALHTNIYASSSTSSSSSLLAHASCWRLVSSLFLATRLWEWVLVVLAWSFMIPLSLSTETSTAMAIPLVSSSLSPTLPSASNLVPLSPLQIIMVYIACTLTGQLWFLAWQDTLLPPNLVNYYYYHQEQRRSPIISMMDFDTTATTISTTGVVCTGCLLWGTCGVLCTLGMLQPVHRIWYFTMTIALAITSFLQQPYNSILGTLGSSYFGWAVGASQVVSSPYTVRAASGNLHSPLTNYHHLHHHSTACHGTSSFAIAILLWIVPLLRIAFS